MLPTRVLELSALITLSLVAPRAAISQESWIYTSARVSAEPATFELIAQIFAVHPESGHVYSWDEGEIQVHDASLANVIDRIPHKSQLHCLHIHEEGRLYAADRAEARVHCYDTEEKKLLWSTTVGPAENRWIYSLDVSPNGELIAVSGRGKLVLLDSSGKVKGESECLGHGVRFSSDGKDLIFGETQFDLSKPLRPGSGKPIRLPDSVSKKCPIVYTRAPGVRGWLAIAENGVFEFTPGRSKWKRFHELEEVYSLQLVVSPTRNGSIWLGNHKDDTCYWTWTGTPEPKLERFGLPTAYWVKDGSVAIASPAGDMIYFMRIREGKPKCALVAFPTGGSEFQGLLEFRSSLRFQGPREVRWSLAGAFESDTIRLLPETITTVALPPFPGEMVARGSTHGILRNGGEKATRRLSLVDLDTREVIPLSIPDAEGSGKPDEKESDGPPAERTSYLPTPGGKFVVRTISPAGSSGGPAGSIEKHFSLYDVAAAKFVREWTAASTIVGPDGTSYSLGADAEKPEEPWTVAESVTGEELWKSRGLIGALAISADGQLLVGTHGLVHARSGASVKEWGPPTGERTIRQFISGSPTSWFFLLSGKRGADRRLEVRDLRTGEVTATAALPKEIGGILAISPDGRWILATSGEGADSRLGIYSRS